MEALERGEDMDRIAFRFQVHRTTVSHLANGQHCYSPYLKEGGLMWEGDPKWWWCPACKKFFKIGIIGQAEPYQNPHLTMSIPTSQGHLIMFACGGMENLEKK